MVDPNVVTLPIQIRAARPRERMVVDGTADGRPQASSLDPMGAASYDRWAPDVDFAKASAHLPLREVVEPVTICVRSKTLLSEARELFAARGLRAVPVIDSDHHLVGILSRSDLVCSMPTSTRVDDVMPSRVHALPEQAPIGYAIALMALERISEVPVVTDDGVVVGLLHALDALRWVAKHLGYVVDSPKETGEAAAVMVEDGLSSR